MSPQHTCMLHIDEFAHVLSGRAVSGGAEAARAVSGGAEADAAEAGSAASDSAVVAASEAKAAAKQKVPCACESAHSSYLEVVLS